MAVIDTGVDYTHPDLAANIWTNPFDPVDGVAINALLDRVYSAPEALAERLRGLAR